MQTPYNILKIQDQSNEVQPPSYTNAVPTCDLMITLVATVLEDAAHLSLGKADAFSTERFRNFLCLVMARDYGIPYGKKIAFLPVEDIRYFDWIFSEIDKFLRHKCSMGLDNVDTTDFGVFLWKHVYAPSQALGLPVEAVVECLRRFALFKEDDGMYGGCHEFVVRTFGFRRLARKFVIDRATIIPRVARNPADSQELLARNRNCAAYWFVRIDGFDFNVSSSPGTGLQGYLPDTESINFELTDDAKRCYQSTEGQYNDESYTYILYHYKARREFLRSLFKRGFRASKKILHGSVRFTVETLEAIAGTPSPRANLPS